MMKRKNSIKGISTVVGILILLLVVIGVLIPLSSILLSKPTIQEQQIEIALPYKNIALQQLADFEDVIPVAGNNPMPPVSFIYLGNNSVVFVLNNNDTPPIPLLIKYLEVFNGTQWVTLYLEKQGNSYIAIPGNQVIGTNGIMIVPSNANTNYSYSPAILIKISPSVEPYNNQAQYIKAVSQYGNIITAITQPGIAGSTTFVNEAGYIFENFGSNNNVTYYSQADAFAYWELANQYPNHAKINPTNPVLQLTIAKNSSSGVGYSGEVYWNQYWSPNQNITIIFIGTFTYSTTYPNALSDGFAVDFLLEPTTWNISSYWNESSNFPAVILPDNLAPNQGTIASAQSSIPYIIVQYQPYYYYSHLGNGTGMWNVYIVNNPTGNNPQAIAWSGIGNGYFLPNPGDLILMNVTYNPTTNTIYGIVKDLNTGQQSVLDFQIPSNDYTPPTQAGNYVFTIEGLNGAFDGNWALVYANVSVLEHLFNPQLASLV